MPLQTCPWSLPPVPIPSSLLAAPGGVALVITHKWQKAQYVHFSIGAKGILLSTGCSSNAFSMLLDSVLFYLLLPLARRFFP